MLFKLGDEHLIKMQLLAVKIIGFTSGAQAIGNVKENEYKVKINGIEVTMGEPLLATLIESKPVPVIVPEPVKEKPVVKEEPKENILSKAVKSIKKGKVK